MLRALIKNPFTLWIKYLSIKYYLEWKYADKKLLIGYMSNISNCQFGNYNVIYDKVSLRCVEIEDFSYIASNSRVTNSKIGKFCCIGSDVIIGPGKHPSRSFVSSHPIFYSPAGQSQITFVTEAIFDEFAQINIGNDVWIGTRAIILDGITIGNGAIVGAGSVVTKDIPPYAIAAGIPATILRYRFDTTEIAFLAQLKWWDRDITWLRENSGKFSNIKEFISILHP